MVQGQLLQRILALIILFLIPLFILKEYKHLTLSKQLFIHTDGEFITNEYANSENKSFVVIIFSHEQNEYCEQTLQSVFAQSYSQFKVVYLNSGSSMGHYHQAEQYIHEHGYQDKTTLIKNADESKLFESFYQLIHSCKDNEVIVHLEGTDWLAHNDVLDKLNKTYKDPDVWLTYGDYMEYPSLKTQTLEPTVNSILRDFRPDKTPWMLSHLKTYYAGVLKQMTPTAEGLSKQALSNEDRMLMLSLLRVGKWHVRFIPEVLAVHHKKEVAESKMHRLMDKVKEQKKHFSSKRSNLKDNVTE